MATELPKNKKTGSLYLVPVPLGESAPELTIPEPVIDTARRLTHFIAENAKSARKFLKSIRHPLPLQDLVVMEIDKHDKNISFSDYFSFLRSGHDTGLLSEAGIPSIADPGAPFVLQAHREKIQVIPLSGPSSILLGLAASGLSGQSFCFHGYLPKEKGERIEKLRHLENQAKRFRQTQIFMETPYRNQSLLTEILNVCNGSTLLCLASNITEENEEIRTQSVAEWKKTTVDLDRKPTVFLIM